MKLRITTIDIEDPTPAEFAAALIDVLGLVFDAELPPTEKPPKPAPRRPHRPVQRSGTTPAPEVAQVPAAADGPQTDPEPAKKPRAETPVVAGREPKAGMLKTDDQIKHFEGLHGKARKRK